MDTKNKIVTIAIVMSFFLLVGVLVYNPHLFSNVNSDNNAIVIVPDLTALAYYGGGFYDYFNKQCDERCLTIPLNKTIMYHDNASSVKAIDIFKKLGYKTISDIEVARNVSILDTYDKIILLHSEYVTQEMFNKIISHKKVIYLYPNALYAEVEIYNNVMKLVKGHGYPTPDIKNGFGWVYENTRPNEYDDCLNGWKFRSVNNGYQLSCYPEKIIKTDTLLLTKIKEL